MEHRGCSIRARTALIVLGLVLARHAAFGSSAGLVVSRQARLEGDLAITNGAFSVAGKSIAWDEVVVAINDASASRQPAANALELRNGEVWSGQIASMRDGQIVLESATLGQRTVPAAEVRALNFQPDLPPAAPAQTNILHRLRGKPSPGALLSIDAKKLSAETALGPLAFDRDKIERYVIDSGAAGGAAPAGARDAVALADGSILYGAARLQGNTLVLSHAAAGERTLPDTAWLWVRRCPTDLVHLADATPASVQTFPLIRRPPDPPRVEYGPGARSEEDAPLFIRRVRLWPRTLMAYAPLPGPAEFRCTVQPEPRSRGPVLVRFRAGEKVVQEQVLTPTNRAVAVAIPLEAGAGLGVEVDFEKAIRFPCGVVLDDPFLTQRK